MVDIGADRGRVEQAVNIRVISYDSQACVKSFEKTVSEGLVIKLLSSCCQCKSLRSGGWWRGMTLMRIILF